MEEKKNIPIKKDMGGEEGHTGDLNVTMRSSIYIFFLLLLDLCRLTPPDHLLYIFLYFWFLFLLLLLLYSMPLPHSTIQSSQQSDEREVTKKLSFVIWHIFLRKYQNKNYLFFQHNFNTFEISFKKP